MILKRLVPLFLLTLLAGHAPAGVLVNRSIVVFDQKQPREDILLTNPSKEKVYLEINVLNVLAPGTPEEKWERAADPETIGLVAAPRRVAIPPGGQRMIRLVNVGGITDQERIYRLHVNPVAGGGTELTGKGIALKVLVGYQLLVVVPPAAPNWSYNGQRAGNQLFLTNTGNSNVFLYDGKQCDLNGDCATLDVLRLYPGNSRTVELPRDAPATYSITAGKSTETRTFP